MCLDGLQFPTLPDLPPTNAANFPPTPTADVEMKDVDLSEFAMDDNYTSFFGPPGDQPLLQQTPTPTGSAPHVKEEAPEEESTENEGEEHTVDKMEEEDVGVAIADSKIKLFVSSLPSNFTEEDISNLFQPFGNVVHCQLFPNKNFAYVVSAFFLMLSFCKINMCCLALSLALGQ